MLVERTFEVNGVRLNVASGPANGPPLLLLHGVARRWQDYAPLLPVLLPRWHVLAADHRGHGRSGRAGSYLVADYVADALALVRSHFREAVVIYGHSLGALTAAAVAAAAPERVRAVVLEDPPAAALFQNLRRSPLHAMFTGMRPLAGGGKSVSETARLLAELPIPTSDGRTTVPLGRLRDATALRFMARCLHDLDPEVLTPVVEERWLEGYNWDQAFTGVRCPALLLVGDPAVGGMLARAEAEAVAARMADCTLIDLPGVGHLIHWLEPEKAARFVLGFLESL